MYPNRFLKLCSIVPFKASNPCTVHNGGCSHFCVVKSSGYECICPTGLTVKQDGKASEDSKMFVLSFIFTQQLKENDMFLLTARHEQLY